MVSFHRSWLTFLGPSFNLTMGLSITTTNQELIIFGSGFWHPSSCLWAHMPESVFPFHPGQLPGFESWTGLGSVLCRSPCGWLPLVLAKLTPLRVLDTSHRQMLLTGEASVTATAQPHLNSSQVPGHLSLFCFPL